jgi:hypothetical protein
MRWSDLLVGVGGGPICRSWMRVEGLGERRGVEGRGEQRWARSVGRG